MTGFLRCPRLPDRPVSQVLISGEVPWLKEALTCRGIAALTTDPEPRLPHPVRFHPDLQVCPFFDKQMFVLKGNSLEAPLRDLGFQVTLTWGEPEPRYPRDVLCGGFLWGNRLVGNPKGVDQAIQDEAKAAGLVPLWVRQGYGACSTALVDQSSAVTGDPGMAKALSQAGFQVLEIRPGHIQLPGYDTGFLGGCCGKLAPGEMAFSGALSSHPDGELIRAFLQKRGVRVLELRKGPLVDVGGILPLLEHR